MTMDAQTAARTTATGQQEDVIYIGDVILFFLHRWAIFLVACVAMIAAAIVYIYVATPLYKASATVAPSSSSSSNSKAGSLNLPFGLGAALGGDGSSTMHKQFLQTLGSYDIAAQLAADKEMGPRIVEPDEGTKVTPGLVGEELKSLLSVSKLRNMPLEDTTFTEVTFLHKDPAFAQQVLQRIFLISDEIVRAQVRETKTAQRDALLRSLEATTNSYQRDALVKNLLEVEHELMTSMTDAPFTYRFIESLHVEERPASPQRALVLTGALVAGFLLGFFIVSVQLFKAYRHGRGRIS